MPASDVPLKSVYLDHHATTPLDERVLEAMQPYLREEFGNAASRTHAFGWRAEAAVDLARESLAEGLGAGDPGEVGCVPHPVGRRRPMPRHRTGRGLLGILIVSVVRPCMIDFTEASL